MTCCILLVIVWAVWGQLWSGMLCLDLSPSKPSSQITYQINHIRLCFDNSSLSLIARQSTKSLAFVWIYHISTLMNKCQLKKSKKQQKQKKHKILYCNSANRILVIFSFTGGAYSLPQFNALSIAFWTTLSYVDQLLDYHNKKVVCLTFRTNYNFVIISSL